MKKFGPDATLRVERKADRRLTYSGKPGDDYSEHLEKGTEYMEIICFTNKKGLRDRKMKAVKG